jgi:hypothetical protein
MHARHHPGIGTRETGIFRQIDEPEDFRAGSIAPTTGQNPDFEMRRRYLCHERLGVLEKD